MDDADDEYNCVSAKHRKPSLDKSQGTIDDSAWNVSEASIYYTATTLNSTDAIDDDASENAERTLCDQHLQLHAEYGKSWNVQKRKNNHSDEA